ncbi:MAG: hypothetical protein P8I44_05725 [Phycisphaerales bacterium]|nr:hypothetical protein [Phycisphaerales bacterium]
MPPPNHFEIVETGPLDRPALARLCPNWFRSHRVDIAWCAVADGEIVAAVMLDFSGEGVVNLDFNGCDEKVAGVVAPALLERAVEAARDCGAAALDAGVSSVAATRHESLLRSAGFDVHETFDRYEVARATMQASLADARRRIGNRIKSRFQGRIEQVEAIHLDAIAAAWSAWIGGSVNHQIFQMRDRFHRRRVDDPEARLQLVAINEAQVVGFCSTRIIEPGVLEVDGEAVHPGFRLDPLQGDLSWAMYERAEAAGIETIRFEAGVLQPNTINIVRRNGVRSIAQKRWLRRPIPSGPDQAERSAR